MRIRTMKFWTFITVLIFMPLGEGKAGTGSVPSIAIMNFTNQTLDDQEWRWLSKGLADMLVTDLARTHSFQLVDREKIQDYLSHS